MLFAQVLFPFFERVYSRCGSTLMNIADLLQFWNCGLVALFCSRKILLRNFCRRPSFIAFASQNALNISLPVKDCIFNSKVIVEFPGVFMLIFFVPTLCINFGRKSIYQKVRGTNIFSPPSYSFFLDGHHHVLFTTSITFNLTTPSFNCHVVLAFDSGLSK